MSRGSSHRGPAGPPPALAETDPLALKAANNLSDLANATTARTNLALGTAATHADGDYQAADSDLAALAAMTAPATTLAKAPRPLFDTLAGTNTTVVGTDLNDGSAWQNLATYTISAGLFATNGDKVRCKFLGDMTAAVAPTALRQIGVALGDPPGGVLFVAGPYTATTDGSWEINIDFMRVSSSALAYSGTGIFHQDDVSTAGDHNATFAVNDDLTGKDLAGTAYTIALFARAVGATAASGDVGLRPGCTGLFLPGA